MPAEEEKPTLRCDTVLLSSRGIAETHGKKAVIFVPGADIERITLKFGRPEHSPIVSLTIGTAFAVVGILGIIEFFLAMRGWRYEIGMMALGAIGGTIIFDALKERYFLEVHSKNDVRRLVFSKNAQKKEIDDFCDQVSAIYKYQISEAGPASK
jgi:hypothetical protein